MDEKTSIETLIDDVNVTMNTTRKQRGRLREKVKTKKRSMNNGRGNDVISSNKIEITRLEEKIEVYKRVLGKLESIESNLRVIEDREIMNLEDVTDDEILDEICDDSESVSMLSDHLSRNFNDIARLSSKASDRLEELQD